MAVTVTPTPASPVAVESFTKFDIAGLTLNETDGSERRYYLTFELASVEKGRSPVFACDHDGGWQFNNYLFPEAGTWHVHVRKVSDDSSVKDQSVTVS